MLFRSDSSRTSVTHHGYTLLDLWYGKVAQFKAALIGDMKQPTAILFAQVPKNTPQFGKDDREEQPVHRGPVNFVSVALEAGGEELYLAPGSPPLVRTSQGIHAFRVPKLDEASVKRVLENLPERRTPVSPEPGYLEYDVLWSKAHWLRVNLFDQPSLTLAALVIHRHG